jgi:hypothetical protein
MVYINAISSNTTLTTDVKELIPNALLRRRMSEIVKAGVSAGMECINKVGAEKIDAIITATGLGCIADSEKFLQIVLNNNEELLNPTPFIQSTFNTVGGQIALMCKNHKYNMTYTHRGTSFEAALLDAVLLIENSEAENVLLGSFDFNIPTMIEILGRLKPWQDKTLGEGSFFFVLSKNKTSETIASVDLPRFLEKGVSVKDLEKEYPNLITKNKQGVFHTASAATLFTILKDIQSSKEIKGDIYIYNAYLNEAPTIMHIYVD